MEGKRHDTDLYFMSNLSHQLRTPLNGIVGYSQLLLKTNPTNTQQAYCNTIISCSLQLVELINNVLDLSKLSSGKAKINNECFSFREVFDEVSSATSCQILEKKQKIQYVQDTSVPEYIVSDRQKIVQILINLVSNANKFTGVGGRLIVSVSQESPSCIEVSVEDNGIGISLQNQKELFTPFFQVDSTRPDSTGLGLTICKKLVELLKGKISVSSEVGKGTIFTFSFSYEPYEEFQKIVVKNSVNLKNKYILVVDDNLDNRVILSEILFDCGMIPIICSSGKEALQMVAKKRYPFSVGLLDVCMPEISGVKLARQIKDVIGMPLVALSSLDDTFDSSNFERIVNKPINKLKILDVLSRVIGKDDVEQFQLNSVETVQESPGVGNTPRVKILLAEDISLSSEMLVKMLNNLGYTDIETVRNGKEAIQKLDAKTYDVLLLDLKMPEVDGIAVTEHLKGRPFPKIAVLSASVLESDREKCRINGVKYFLLKPVNMSHLRTIMSRLVYGSVVPEKS